MSVIEQNASRDDMPAERKTTTAPARVYITMRLELHYIKAIKKDNPRLSFLFPPPPTQRNDNLSVEDKKKSGGGVV